MRPRRVAAEFRSSVLAVTGQETVGFNEAAASRRGIGAEFDVSLSVTASMRPRRVAAEFRLPIAFVVLA